MAGVAQCMNIAISATGCLYLHFINWIQLLQVLLRMEEMKCGRKKEKEKRKKKKKLQQKPFPLLLGDHNHQFELFYHHRGRGVGPGEALSTCSDYLFVS